MAPPQSVSSLLDEERRQREEPTTVWDLTGSNPPCSFPTMLPEGWDRPLAPCLPFHVARQLVLGNKGGANTADLRRIRQLMHPMKD